MTILRSIKRGVINSFRLGVKDLVVFARDRMRLLTFIIMPIFMMIMIGFVFPSQGALKDAPLGIVNLDQGPLGRQIVAILSQPDPQTGDRLFKITNASSETEAVRLIEKQAINGAIVIPADFSTRLSSGGQGVVTVITDQANPQVSIMISGVLDRLMSEISTRLAEQKVAALGVADPTAVVKPFVVATRGVVPGTPNYFQFMAPGLMAMVIMMAAMTGLAGSISREHELGTLDGILTAPISRLSIILGKSFAQAVRGLIQAGLTLVLAMAIFGVVVQGSLGLLVLLLVLTVFSFIGIGIIISAVASEQETAMTIMMTITFPMIFLSGAFFPVQQMPAVMQWISRALPLTYSVESLRKCIVLGTGMSGMMTEIWVMLGFGVIFTAVAIPIFNQVMTR